jgi:hypothetical protein
MYRAQWSLHFHSLGIYMYVKVNQCSKQFSVRLSVCVWENSPFSRSTHFHVAPVFLFYLSALYWSITYED